MSDFHCDICDRTIQLKYKKKQLYTRLHRVLSTSIAKNPPFLQLEDTLKKHVYDYRKKDLVFLLLYVN